ncbi:DUF2000 domain-containing protein [Desulfovibrio subterraneus]|uniref:DUF2000 domain-containing protein n=1 Tax=Desulfovibrio subterraneus TaxID=2718620 RepID=UPI0022B8D63A|nr:DUF2000 domain-containing protein [Desulfovibrio subterraneus]WBF67359.1 DUF2000 domain-containing protein [Desulfovibrio subterraneus]
MTVNKDSKCVFVIDENLPKGLAANTAAVLATAVTVKVGGMVGTDVTDGGGFCHPAITQVPIPILKASADELATLHAVARADDDLLVAGFSDIAQRSRSYDEYAASMAALEPEGMRFLGVALFGRRKRVASLTGMFGLM